jgi:hypothetical protein
VPQFSDSYPNRSVSVPLTGAFLLFVVRMPTSSIFDGCQESHIYLYGDSIMIIAV